MPQDILTVPTPVSKTASELFAAALETSIGFVLPDSEVIPFAVIPFAARTKLLAAVVMVELN